MCCYGNNVAQASDRSQTLNFTLKMYLLKFPSVFQKFGTGKGISNGSIISDN
jgi:hypothetical protein